jgi:O-antigen ligase/tetratricopeptide (TPR) repeat protein
MKLQKAIIILFCAMVIVMPVFTSMLRLEKIGLVLNRFSNEAATLDWVKLYYFATAIGALYVISLFTPGAKRIQFNRADVPILGFLALGLIMLIADHHRFDSSRRMTELISGFTIYFVGKNVFTEPRYKKALLICLAAGIGFVSILGIVHYIISFYPKLATNFILPPISPDSVPWEAGFGIRATSTLGNPNFMADILIFVIPIWIGAIIFVKKDAPAGWMAVLAVVTFLLLLFTNSWGGYMGVILSTIVMILLTAIKKPKIKYSGLAVVVIAACIIATALFFGIKKGEALGKGKTGEEELVGVKSRRILWESAWQMVFPDREQFPEAKKWRCITGWGLDNFFTYSNLFLSKFSTADRYKPLWEARPEFLLRNPGRPHNEILGLMVELGIPGLIVFVLIFVFYVRDILKEWKPGREIINDIFIFGVVGGIFAVWAQSLVSYPFRLGVAWMTICTGMGVALQGTEWRTREFNVSKTNLRMAAMAFVSIFAVYLLYQNTVSAVCLYKYEYAMERYLNDFRNSRYAPEKIANYPDDEVIDDLMYCANHWHKDHETYFKLATYLIFRDRLDEAKEALTKLEYIQPYHEKTHFFWGEYYRRKGEYEKAIESYRNAIKYEPRFMTPKILLIETYIKTGKLKEAQEMIDNALAYEPEAAYRLAKIDKKRKDLETRRRSGDKEAQNEIVPLPHLEDILFYWIHNAQAIVYAVNGKSDDAKKELDNAWKMFEPYSIIMGIPIHSFHPPVPVFELNNTVVESIKGKQPPSDISEWTSLFVGACEWDTYDRLDRYQENETFAGRWAVAKGNISLSNKHFEKAYGFLTQIESKFPSNFILSGPLPLCAREINNRYGILFMMWHPAQIDKAIECFNKSIQNSRNLNFMEYNVPLNIANYNITLSQMIKNQDRRADNIPFLNEKAEDEIRKMESEAMFALEKKKNLQIAEDMYLKILGKYPLWAPEMVNLTHLLISIRENEQAKAIVKQALEFYPTHPQLRELGTALGIRLPQN